jgi:ABC-type sugar transport system ATPase subunit
VKKLSDYILQTKNIVKQFPGTLALDQVNINIKRGEIHALLGENGAGKSTLILTLGGLHQPNSGEIILDGEEVVFDSPLSARENGISVVHQELSLLPNLSIAENIFTTRQPVNKIGFVDDKQMEADTTEMLRLFNLENIKPSTLVKYLPIAKQQVVEILKAISDNPRVLILDEPTSSLTNVEKELLFENLRRLKKQNIAIIYISHHLNEVFQIADVMTILRDGRNVCVADVKNVDENYIVTNMVGRKVESNFWEKNQAGSEEKYFEARNVSSKGAYQNISFHVKKGEIVGFAGLIGSGRTEMARGIMGIDPKDSGEIFLEGKQLKINFPSDALDHGIGYVTEERKITGLFLDFSVSENIISNKLKSFSRKGFMNDKEVSTFGMFNIKDFGIKVKTHKQKLSSLSGGNQQKTMLATWFSMKPKVLIIDEPTRGVDVGAKSDIYTKLREIADTGVSIVVISSELLEVLGVSDRLYVMRQGEIVGELSNKEATEESVIALAAGIAKTRKEEN